MSDRYRDQIVETALAAFMRYGFRRVTMGDLAKEAGISRPTLYAAFPNKEEVFRAVVSDRIEASLAEIRALVATGGPMAEQLEQIFEIWVVRGYEMMSRAPDAQELIECKQAFTQDLFDAAYAELEEILASVLAPRAARGSGGDPHQLARTVTASIRGIKESAKDLDDLRDLLGGLVAMTVGTLSAPATT